MAAAAASRRDPSRDGIDAVLAALATFDRLTATPLDAKANRVKLQMALTKVNTAMRLVSVEAKSMRAIERDHSEFTGNAGAYIDFEQSVASMPADTPAMANSLAQNRKKAWLLMRRALVDFRSGLKLAAG